MSKLLARAKLIEGVTEKSPKKRYKKTRLGEKPRYRVVVEDDKSAVEKLMRVYKETPYNARVMYLNDTMKYSFYRLVLFEFENGDFEFSYFINKFGISKSNKIYSRQKKVSSLSYKRGKFWTMTGGIKPTRFQDIQMFMVNYERKQLAESFIFSYFESKFHWIRMLSETPLNVFVTLTTVKDKELYGMNELHRYLLGVPSNIVKVVLSSELFMDRRYGFSPRLRIKEWKSVVERLEHIEFLREEMLNSPIFMDTYEMARTLDRKINCKWGLKRLTAEHDKWSIDINNILLSCEIERELNIASVYHRFAEYSGFKLLKTNKEVISEGLYQKHCVGTYINKIESGSCAIFHVGGYTLQLGVKSLNWGKYDASLRLKDKLRPNESVSVNNVTIPFDSEGLNYYKSIDRQYDRAIVNLQFKGFRNGNPPQELVEMVEQKLIDFTNSGGVVGHLELVGEPNVLALDFF